MKNKTSFDLMHLIRGLLLACLVFTAAAVTAPTAQAATANERATFEFLTSTMGLNPAAACGVMGSIKAESEFNSNIYGLGGAYGICQWMGVRISRLQNYCSQHGLNYTTLNGQLHYLAYETKNTFPSVYSYLKNVSNTADGAYNAGYYWCYNFETPADRSGASAYRASIARNVYWKEFGGTLYLRGAQVTGGVKLNWSGSSKHGFAVRRADKGSGNFTTVGTTSASVKTFTDKTAAAGKTYQYYIRPLKADGSLGEKSNCLTMTGRASLNNEECIVTLSKTSYNYSGKACKPAVSVKWDGNLLAKNKQYTVTYRNNVKAGTATVIVKGKGTYTGTVKAYFRINKRDQVIKAKNTVLQLKGKAQRISFSAQGKCTLVSSNPGVVSVKGKNAYTKKAGTAVITIKAAATSKYNAAVKQITVTVRPSLPVVSAANVSGHGIKASWKSAGAPSGYQVRYMDMSDTSKMEVIDVDGRRNTTAMINNLTKGKTYTVRVRSYTLEGDTKIWSDWSKVVKVRIER